MCFEVISKIYYNHILKICIETENVIDLKIF